MQEVELAGMHDDGPFDRALEAEVELLEGLSGREPRPLDPPLATAGVSPLRKAAGLSLPLRIN
jgi:hypothetical protein